MRYVQYFILALFAVWPLDHSAADGEGAGRRRAQGKNLSAGGNDVAVAVLELMERLERERVAVDTNSAVKAVVEAVLSKADPHSRVLSSDESERFDVETGSINETAGSTTRVSVAIAENWPNGFRYVKLSGLYRGTWPSIAGEIAGTSGTNDCKGIILDLRDAGGGGLDGVDRIAGLFLKQGTELYRVCHAGDQGGEIHVAVGDRRPRVPVAVLTSANTRGAPEILVAVLKGSSEAVILGGHTAGDARIRETMAFGHGLVLFFAPQEVVLQNGVQWKPGGISPDVEVDSGYGRHENGVNDSRKTAVVPAADAPGDTNPASMTCGDAVVQRAVDVLTGMRALGIHATGN